MELLELIEGYRPWNEQEERDRASMLAFAARNPDCLLRENLAGHFTASVWVVNPRRTKTLMVYHSLYQSWSWIGGHADGEADLTAVALRELGEETGVTGGRLVSPQPCSLEQLFVAGHEKRGQYVPCHLHLNLTWLVEVAEGTPLRPCPGENTGVRWLTPAQVREQVHEPWMLARVYEKLMGRYFTGN
ncbi:MAG: NUDIX hydrolase [Clostridiales bacterium]|nr:NUDIX hydrolase [Clostridiales bacterium]